MSVVKINAIEVAPGGGPALEQRFAARAGQVDKQPGFEELLVLRPVAGDSRYFVVTRWASEEAYQAWRNGPAFAEQHRQTHQSEGHGAARPEHPIGARGTLLEFEVVSRTSAAEALPRADEQSRTSGQEAVPRATESQDIEPRADRCGLPGVNTGASVGG